MLLINQVLQQGRYHIISQFEHEETGVSYQAFDNVLKKSVIIKETSFDLKLSPNVQQYPLAKQIENLTSIQHESFTRIHGFFSEVDRQYLVTESVEGQSLKELLEKTHKPFSLLTVLDWAEKVLNALNYLHSKIPPIIHRDITPSNLILTKDNKIKLLTYPIIKEFQPRKNKNQEKQFSELQLPFLPLEVLWETLDYASQKVILNSYDEQSAEILESPFDERSDLYSLGATIYYLATGKTPTNALERSIDLLEGKADPLAKPYQLNSQITRNISAFLMKALEIKRENRFESAVTMLNDLQPILNLMRKAEMETKMALSDPKVTEAALREVELARQTLRKQKEEEKQKKIREAKDNWEEILSQNIAQKELEKAEQRLVEEEERLKAVQVQSATQSESEESSLNYKDTQQTIDISVLETEPEVIEVEESNIIQPIEDLTENQLKPISQFAEKEIENELFVDFQPERKGLSWLIPVFLGIIVLAVGGFFGFKYLSANTSTNSVQPVTEQNASNKTDNPVETTNPQTDNPANVSVNPPANTPEQAAQTLPNSEVQKEDESTIKAKKSTLPIQQVEKKTPPAAAKTPLPKKKEITVDDIINDN